MENAYMHPTYYISHTIKVLILYYLVRKLYEFINAKEYLPNLL